MSHNVFVSSSPKDKKISDTILEELENQGMSCWFAPRNMVVGTSLEESAAKAIETSEVVVVVLSENSKQSKQVLHDVEQAVLNDIQILPFCIENIKHSGALAYYIGSENWLDAITPPLEKHILKLSTTLKQMLSNELQEETSFKGGFKETIEAAKEILTGDKKTKVQEKAKADVPYMLKINPFTFGNPVFEPGKFYGREGDIRQIVSRLLSAGESTSIVGERRIGKTSLLKHLATPEVAQNLGLSPEKYCLVYIDFQGLTDITPERFWQRVLRKMERSICKPDLVPEIQALRKMEAFDLFDLEDLFENLTWEGLTTILFMDEFEYVTRNPNFGSDFFGGLRALAIHQNLALVTGTRRELVDLCHSDEIKGSPFFNIFANLVLRPFNRTEVRELIEGYFSKTDETVSEREQKLVLHLGGGYPFFVQMGGHYLLEAKWKNLEGDAILEDVVRKFNEQAEPHLDYFWSHSSESEKITLLSIIALSHKKPSKKTLPTVENLAKVHTRAHLDVPELTKRGMLVENRKEDTYTLFSPSFEDWIFREIMAASGEEESQASVEEWVSSGGRDEVVPLSGVLPKFKKKYWPIVSSVMHELSFELVGAATFELLMKALL